MTPAPVLSLCIVYSAETKAVAAAAAPIALLRAGISAAICASEGSTSLLYIRIPSFSQHYTL